MGSLAKTITNSSIEFERVDWDNYIKRWLLYALRLVPNHCSVASASAEDLVFQAIDAVLSGRRRYVRPGIFANSDEPDHQGPLFVYLCGVIRSLASACYKKDRRHLDWSDLIGDEGFTLNGTRLLANCGYLTQLEQLSQLDAFRNYLVTCSDDSLLVKILDALTDPKFAELTALEKAEKFDVTLVEFNNAMKRFRRNIVNFLRSLET